jgi:hypothetical protein
MSARTTEIPLRDLPPLPDLGLPPEPGRHPKDRVSTLVRPEAVQAFGEEEALRQGLVSLQLEPLCRGRSKSGPLRRRRLLAPSVEEAKAQAALRAWTVRLFAGNEHRPATAPMAGAFSAPVAWIRTAPYTSPRLSALVRNTGYRGKPNQVGWAPWL